MPVRRALAAAAATCALAAAPTLALGGAPAHAAPPAPVPNGVPAATAPAPAPAATAPVPAAPAPNAPTETLTVAPARPSYSPGEPIDLTGRVGDATGRGVPGALVVVTVDNDTAAPLTAETDAQGEWRLQVPARPGWSPGVLPIEAAHVPGVDVPGASARTTVQLGSPASPVVLTAAPLAAPVTQGTEVELTGRLALPDGRPVAAQSVYVSLAPAGDAAAFGSTDERGEWRLRVRIPDDAGATLPSFPAFPVTVTFDGNPGVGYDPTPALAPASAVVPLTLSGPPVTRPSTPAATPTPAGHALAGQRPVHTASATPAARAASQAPASATARVAMPSVTSPGALLLGSGIVATVMGAAMLSHAARLRH